MKALIIAACVCASTVAHAQQQPRFTPFTVDEKSYNELRTYLNAQPYGMAAPLMRWLDVAQYEAQAALDNARARAEADAKAKADADKKE